MYGAEYYGNDNYRVISPIIGLDVIPMQTSVDDQIHKH